MSGFSRVFKFKRPRLIKVLAGFFVSLVLVLGVVAAVLPYVLGALLKEQLIAQGNTHVIYDDIDLNLFTGVVSIEGLFVADSDWRVLEVRRAYANVSMMELLKGRIEVAELNLEGVFIRIDDARRLRVAGMALAAKEHAVDKKETSVVLPAFRIRQVRVLDSRVAVYLAGLDVLVNFDEIALDAYAFDADAEPAPFSLKARLGDGRVSVDGAIQADAVTQSLTLNLALDQIALDQFNVPAAQGGFRLSGVLAGAGKFLVKHESETVHIEESGDWRVERVAAGNADARMAFDALSWRGREVFRQVGGKTSIESSADLGVHGVRLSSGASVLAFKQAQWKGRVDASALKGWTFARQQGEGSIKDLVVEYGDIDLKARADTVGWSAATHQVLQGHVAREEVLSVLGRSESDDWVKEGRLKIEGVSVSFPDGDVAARDLSWQGHVSRRPALAIAGTVSGTGLAYRDSASDKTLLSLAQASVPQIEFVPAQRLARAGVMQISGMQALIHILGDKRLLGVPGPTASTQAQEVVASKPEAPSPWRLGFEGVQVSGDNRIEIRDSSLEREVTTQISSIALELGALYSDKPLVATPLKLSAHVGEYGRVNGEGQVMPLAQRPTAHAKLELRSIDLAGFSPYAERYSGYAVQSGQLNADTDIKVDLGQLDAKVHLTLRSLDLSPKDSDKVASLTTQLTMPLELVLSTLQDKRGDLKITVPVTGDVRDPKFNFMDVMRLATYRVLQSATLSYLKHALQPYGSLITLVGLAEKAANYIGLDPVNFPPGQGAVPAESFEYLEKIAQLMKDRPHLRIKLCASATGADRAVLGPPPEAAFTDEARQALLALARERALNVKRYLIETHQVDGNNLFVCTPVYKEKPDAQPRVALGL